MEAGGLALGAVALVSLVKDCVDLYSMFASAQKFEKDSSTLATKLDIEKMMFKGWSERVSLLEQDQNEDIFGDAQTRDLIMRILEKIKDLLSDGKKLENTYGLQSLGPPKQSDSNITPKRRLEFSSDFQLSQLIKDFRNTKIKRTFRSCRSKKLDGIAKQITWVIVDKEKFNQLISDLSYYNNGLAQLTPGSISNTKDHSSTHSGTTLNVTVEVSEEDSTRQEAAMVAQSEAIQSLILDTLWFRWLDDRRLTVKEAHAKTFSWALEPKSRSSKWHHLPSWLQHGSGIYWLFGKAGSGKSTLMKFLHDDQRTQEYLGVWAGESELVFTSFFFYAQGQPEQKSQVGLLRSILHQILINDAALTETVLPNAWREGYRRHRSTHGDLSMPSISELMTALKDICKSYQATKKMFFLIDGIDEYGGEHTRVADFISELGEFSNVKVLVSSRPLNTFINAFRNSPQMDLPDLTEQDIASYVYDTVNCHPYIRDLSAMNPHAVELITKSLIKRASGVFLWVVLVCRSIIEGCDDNETVSDLQTRVDESPKEVEDLLNHILGTIDPRWEDRAMKIMHLVHTNQSCETAPAISTLGLYLIDEQGINSDMYSSEIIGQQPFTAQQIELRCSIMEKRLRSICRGLVEVKRPTWEQRDNRSFWFDNKFNGLSVHHCHVDFMHRTVYDLLLQPDTFNRHFGKIMQQGFNSYFVLCHLWCQLAATCNKKRSCTKPSHKNRSCNRLACLYSAVSVVSYGNANGCVPNILLHCISKIQYTCGMFLSKEFRAATKHFLHDRNCRNYYKDMSVVLALAAECGLDKTIQFMYESNDSLGHLLYQPRSLESLGSCDSREPQTTAALSCRENHSFHKLDTGQGALSIRNSLTSHCLFNPVLREPCHIWFCLTQDIERLRALEFIFKKESLELMEAKTLSERFDKLCEGLEMRCPGIYKDIQIFLHEAMKTLHYQ